MDRRNLLALTAGFAGAAGVATGYKLRDPIRNTVRPIVYGTPREDAPGDALPQERFSAEAARVMEQHRRQTKQTVLDLKAKYESPVLGKFRVWDLIEKLALCVDPTDISLGCTNQYLHVCQVTASLEETGEADETMLLTALVHDLGKVAMLAGEAPEHVVCMNEPIEGPEPGAGLEKAIFQFGHDEIAYSRLKDHVPEHVAWMVRYHTVNLGMAEPYMSARDRELEAKYLQTFRKHDRGSKSMWTLPNGGSLARYRNFVEEQFPAPILF